MGTHKKTKLVTRTALATAVATVLGTIPIHQIAAAETDDKSATVDEVLVTVRKRQETVQDIPATVQALSEDFLEEVGAKNMEDYTRFIPGVTLISYTPGSSSIIFRGISTGVSDFIAVAGASVYLNDSSITSVASQPDVRMIDVQGVQALAGPQGTIYGGSAQAGIMRIQTNQPDLSGFEGSVGGDFRSGPDSDASYSVNAMLNIPMSEEFAIRIAAEKANDGGFIDNVLGHTPDGSSLFNSYVPAEAGTMNNSNVAEKNWNGVDYSTFRVSARWEPNDDWAVTFMHHRQTNEAHGENDYNPYVGDLQTVYFNENYRKDEWDLTSLTVEGDLGWAELVSTVSFFKRDINSTYDSTVYFRYYNQWCASAYWFDTYPDPANIENGTAYGIYLPAYCVGTSVDSDLTAKTDGPAWNENLAWETRLSHQGDKFDWLGGIFFEKGEDNWDSHWALPTTSDGNAYGDSISAEYYGWAYGEDYSNAEGPWLSTDRTDWTQSAIFGEVTWHINDKTDLTVGGRYFKRDNDKNYIAYLPDVRMSDEFGPGGIAHGVASGTDSDFVPKVNLSYKLDDNKMIYGLYSKGFRPGGTNRGRGEEGRTVFPRVFGADYVENYELGAKTRWADNTVQLNMSIFYMDWSDYQLEVIDPSKDPCTPEEPVFCAQPWQKVVANVGDAHSTGAQVEVSWVPAEGWEVGGNAQWIEAMTDTEVPIANIPSGTRLPNIPSGKVSGWLSRSWEVDFIPGAEMVFRGQFSYTGESDNQMALLGMGEGNPLHENEDYLIADFSLGLTPGSKEWSVSLYLNNATDERAQYYHSTGYSEYPFSSSGAQGGAPYSHYHRVYTNRPMEYGVRFNYAWGD